MRASNAASEQNARRQFMVDPRVRGILARAPRIDKATLMQTVHSVPAVSLNTAPAAQSSTELLVIPVFEQDDLQDVSGLDGATGGEVSRAQTSGEFRGKLYELFFTPAARQGWKAHRVALVGAGPRKEFTTERLRRIATTAGLAARQRRVTTVALLYREHPGIEAPLAAQALAEGLILANYNGGSYKTGDEPRGWVERAEVVMPSGARSLEDAVERGRILGECSNMARELANEPSNTLTPRVFADRAAALAKAAGLKVDVLSERRIEELNMGLLLGVARGSVEPPRVIVLTHEPNGAPAAPVLGLIGKGITFDTGGISIKPAENMDRMKDDMAGGAAVIAATIAAARLNAPVRIVAVVPATENMPSGTAVKPGDVLRGASGKTVEVLNTDAEGRLILGDGLWYAQQLGATHLVDVATLTGACIVALGKSTNGLFANHDGWRDVVLRATERAGDRSWPMPTYADYFEQLKSEIADFTNTGGRPAGAITAALFIKEFANDLPWAHLDIAGTAWADEPKPYQPKGATGVAVRTLAELALDVERWRDLR
jgi:leucyl aminopeptidase